MIEELAADELEDDLEDNATESDNVDNDDGDDSDNVGDSSIEINVEELISKLESDGLVKQLDCEKSARKRLEELMERKRALRELEDFDDYDI